MEVPWEQIFSFLERVVPAVIASLSVGYNLGQKDIKAIKTKLALAEYELEKLRNEEKVRLANRGKSASDIVDDFLRGKGG